MQGKIVLVTGATNGIGRVTAQALAQMGAEVVILSRDAQRVQETVQEISAETGNPAVSGLAADLSVQADVMRAAQEFRAKYKKLDVLVNNAGAVFVQRQLSADGLEMTFALNHMNYFLLTHLLLEPLQAAGKARVVNVSSAAHWGMRLDFDDLQREKSYQSWKVYGQSKLANLYFTYELARKLSPNSSITVNALHPGFVATNFGRSNGGIFDPLFRLSQIAAISPEKGAQTSIYLASSPEVEGVTGKYFSASKPVSSSKESYDIQAAQRLWEISAKLSQMKTTIL